MNYVITIGRQYGSGGRYVGKLVAEELGIKFYDNELLSKVAQDFGFCESFIKENDEKRDGIFSYMGGADPFVVSTPSQSVANAQFRTIEKLANEESCVVVGRCSNYILRDHKNVLNVFISAPQELREKRAVKYYGVPQEKVKKVLRQMDKRRANYYNYYTEEEWGFSANYDLCLSTALSVEECARIIADCARHMFN